MPNIGYGSSKKTKHLLPNGFLKFMVHNVKDLDMLLMHNRCACASDLPPREKPRRRAFGPRSLSAPGNTAPRWRTMSPP
jgi:ribosomal protein L32E